MKEFKISFKKVSLKCINKFAIFFKGVDKFGKMDNFFITPEETIELLKKKYKNKNKEADINNITQEEIDDFVVNCETERFNDIFNRVFEEDLLPFEKAGDCEDGSANEICLKIVATIKNYFDKIDKEKLLKFLLKLISDLIVKKED